MNHQPRKHIPSHSVYRLSARALLGLSVAMAPWAGHGAVTQITLADQPLFTGTAVPGNLALALSVEYPTASTPAYLSSSSYSPSTIYTGYFDPYKCYLYTYDTTTPANSYFSPQARVTPLTTSCSPSAAAPLWSGNYLNWASMQALDIFRWVLTGGNRKVDTEGTTILQKTFASGQDKSLNPTKILSANKANSTPLGAWSTVNSEVAGNGFAMLVSSNTSNSTTEDYKGHNTLVASSNTMYAKSTSKYKIYMNVKVCDSVAGLEDNCITYPTTSTPGNAKPEGLMQKYNQKLRYAAFGYLNDANIQRDGGVMRAAMSYIGPTQPVPGSDPITNTTSPEWSASTGVMYANPVPNAATATTSAATAAGASVSVTNSGVMNYLNKFGDAAGQAGSSTPYKQYDPTSELYYAVTRYFRNLGNVPEYSSLTGGGSNISTWIDGFPIITSWTDPIIYSCQKNFILGIGDVNTHRDSNLPGSSLTTSSEPTKPSSVTSDTAINVTTSTNMVGQLEGLGSLATKWVSSGRGDTYYIAGLAYDAHTTDIRSDLTGTQSINTYWLDVLEGQTYLSKNEYWLATKYGGFEIPTGFKPYASTNGTSTIPQANWYTNTGTILKSSDKRPDNYFLANDPTAMKNGLEAAFQKIVAEATTANSTSYATASPNVISGTASYSASYSPKYWTGDVIASAVTYASDGNLTQSAVWSASTLLDAKAFGTRRIVSFCDKNSSGISFSATALANCGSSTRSNITSFSNVSGISSSNQSSSNFINYLRGDRTKEIQNGGAYRNRAHVLGDIVGSKINAVAKPSYPYYDVYNPGYNAFKLANKSRATTLYVGANDGMLHAFNGALSGTDAGQELFAYIPSFVYGSSTSGPVSGLASLGAPSFTHHQLVNGTARHFDVDFNWTSGNLTTTKASNSDWHTVLIGALGKGGKGYYALDITSVPSSSDSEATIASKVLWEFPRPDDSATISKMGYSFGEPSVVKTKKYGWTVIIPSGYNNGDGIGYFFLVNPKTGALLQTIATPEGGGDAPINMGQLRAYIPDYTDYTADSVYAGDLNGNVWRLDLTSPSGTYPAPTKIAKFTYGTNQPITTRPVIGVDPSSKKRYVMMGTGRLLDDTDIYSSTNNVQSFYAIADGTSAFGGFYSTLPSGYEFPIQRKDLNLNSSLIDGIGSSPASPMGWYFDLGTTSVSLGGVTKYIAARVNIDPDVNEDLIAFAANTPNGDACSPAGTSKTYVVRFPSGKTVLTDVSGNFIQSSNRTSAITDIVIQNVQGKVRVNVGDAGGTADDTPTNTTVKRSITRLNWREVPSQD